MSRAALVTGASSGIGLAVARALGQEGHDLTVVSRRPENLERARAELEAEGLSVTAFAADLSTEDGIVGAVAHHRERWGRLDVLVNNAGLGIGSPIGELKTKHADLQWNTNVRAYFLAYREAVDLLRASAAEHGAARVVNLASIVALQPQAWTSVYSATKAAVRAMTVSMNRELAADGILSTALCPGFVATPMTEFAQGAIPAEEMISTQDIAESVRMLLRLSRHCIVPEIPFIRPGDSAL